MALFGLMLILLTVHGDDISPDRSAVLFKNKGTVELSGRSYLVLVEVSVENLIAAIKPIGDAIMAVSLGLDRNFKKLSLINPRRTIGLGPEFETNMTNSDIDPFTSLSHTLSVNMQEHIQFLTSEIEHKHLSLTNFVSAMATMHLNGDSSHLRKSRGP